MRAAQNILRSQAALARSSQHMDESRALMLATAMLMRRVQPASQPWRAEVYNIGTYWMPGQQSSHNVLGARSLPD